jgi:bla regulator protein BlaR1
MGNEFLLSLGSSCLAFSLVVIFVLTARSVLRNFFGAGTAYLVWLAVPMVAAAPLFPQVTSQVWTFIPMAPLYIGSEAVQEVSSPSVSAPQFVMGLWLCGVVLTFNYFLIQHLRFSKAIGNIQKPRAFLKSFGRSNNISSPLLLGLWRPVIVVPSDFRKRYSAHERLLILAHERTHLQRYDPIANVICAVLQCVFWFNPLAHLAAVRFRFDQELGCDDIVMRRYPGKCRSYAEAILKSQTSSLPTPLACQLQVIHPLKVRIMQLQKTTETNARRNFGRSLIAATICALTYGAWSAQAQESGATNAQVSKSPQIYEIAIVINAGGEVVNPRVRTIAGLPATIEFGTAPKIWTVVVELTPREGMQVVSKMSIQYEKKSIASPKLVHALNESAGIQIGATDTHPSFDLKLNVQEWKSPN